MRAAKEPHLTTLRFDVFSLLRLANWEMCFYRTCLGHFVFSLENVLSNKNRYDWHT